MALGGEAVEHDERALVVGGEIELPRSGKGVLVGVNGNGGEAGQPEEQADDDTSPQRVPI